MALRLTAMGRTTAEGTAHVRAATADDLPVIVALLRDDALGATRERAPGVAGVLQLSFLRCLTHEGGLRAQIEGVRVDRARRGGGLGRVLIGDAVRRARERGCHLVQLTTDRRRPDALAFYQRLGFVDTHHGLKLELRR